MNNINTTNLSMTFFQFGPLIAHYKLNDKFIEELNNKGKKTSVDFKSQLAGHIKKENAFEEDDKKWFLTNTQNIFSNYINQLKSTSGIKNNFDTITLQNLWINFMKSGEFNPPHDHSGDISFVIYTSVPKEIHQENQEFKGRGSGPGCISFLYGENSKSYKSEYRFIPEKSHMFIFPATLRHYVAPFQSKVTRISISGNIILQLKNNILTNS